MSGENQTRAMTTVLQRRAAAAQAARASSETASGAPAPRHKSRRVAVSAVLTVTLLAAAVLVVFFGVRTCLESIRRQTDETAALRRETAEMRQVIDAREETARAVAETMRTHASLKDTLLEPLLGSYAMRVKTMLEPEADAAGLSGAQFTDVNPVALMPAVTPVSKSPYAYRSVRVTAYGSYQRLASFLCRVERLYPSMLTESVSISSELGLDIGRQRGEFVFSWLSAREGEGTK